MRNPSYTDSGSQVALSPNVSVIIPIYNIGREYLTVCVESVLSQTFQEIEIILIEDGSPNEEDVKLCDEYCIDERIKVVHQSNQGVSASRNIGMQYAEAEWIMFVDPDDYLVNNCIETLFACTGELVDVVTCCCKVILEQEEMEDHFFRESRVLPHMKRK